MPTWLRLMVAEAVGTFFLVFPGVGAALLPNATLLGEAVANGLGLAIGISVTLAVSGGACNPAVSVGLWSLGKLKTATAILYIIAELVGAVVAAVLLHWLIPGGSIAAGTPVPGSGVTPLDAAGLELVLTFLLMMAVLMTAVDATAPKIAGFGIGLVVVMDVLAAGPLTGAAMNPARAFGPELISGTWAAAWAYWVGPIVGALLACLLYRYFLQAQGAPVAAAGPAPGARAQRRGGRAGAKR